MKQINKQDLQAADEVAKHLQDVKEKEEADKRAKECEDELIKLLNKYNCALDAVMIVGRSGCVPQITLVAKK